jgi:hypothetical protein
VIFLPYSAEVFVFLQLLGLTHATWWLLPLFLFNDAAMIQVWKNHKRD